MNNSLFIGIDISKFKHDIAVMDKNKKLVSKPFVITENAAGYSYLLERLNKLKKKYLASDLLMGMESTADYWKNLFHFFHKQPDFSVVVINPVRTKAFAQSELRRAKTDPVNAKDIALFLVEKKPPASYYRPPLLDTIKDLTSQIYALKKQQTISINRLRGELGKVAPEIEQNFRNITGKQLTAVLSHLPTAEMIAQASVEKLREEIHYGKKQWRIPESFLLNLKKLADNSIAYKSGPGAGLVVQALLRSIDHDQTEIEFLKEQMKQLYQTYQDDNVDILRTIKGVTHETAIILDAFFGDVNRFDNARQFVAFFGMNPVVNQSGKPKKRKSYLEKKGSAVVRHKLFLVTLTLIREKVEPFYKYFHHLLSAGKVKLVAIGAVMRKLLVIMFQMLKNQEPFDYKKFKKR